MLALTRVRVLLAAFFASASASSLHSPAVYNNCTGNGPSPPTSADSTPFYAPQIRVNPLEVMNNGTGWEEWLVWAHTPLPDGTELLYSYKFVLGDPTSANISHYAFIGSAYFPNGTEYREIVHEEFKYAKYDNGGFKLSVGESSLTWDPEHEYWNASINANGLIIETYTEDVKPQVPYVPNYKGVPGLISEDFYSRIEVPRGHASGHIAFPWGEKYDVQAIGNIKHTWSNKIMADTISAYVRGSTYLPSLPSLPVTTVSWYQAWDTNGKEVQSMQFSLQPDGPEVTQDFRLQLTDVPDILTIVTSPKPEIVPPPFDYSELTLPFCGPGADFGDNKHQMTWKVWNNYKLTDFVDFAGGITTYRHVNMTGTIWYNGSAIDVAGGIGIVEVYHR